MKKILLRQQNNLKGLKDHRWVLPALVVQILVLYIITFFLFYCFIFEVPRQSITDKIPDSIRSLLKEFRDPTLLKYNFFNSNLPHYDLYLTNENLKTLNDYLPKSETEFLTREHRIEVPGIFLSNKKSFNVDVSYRGDKSRHWFYEKKSLTIEFSSDDLFEESMEIKLIVPFDRAYIGESFNTYRATKLGLAAPKDKFVTLSINGGPKALYYQQEPWGKAYLEHSFGTSNGNLYGEKNLEDKIFETSFFWKKYVSIEDKEDDYSDLDHLLTIINSSNNEEFAKEISTILDVDTALVWNVHSLLAGSIHQDNYHNARFFYDNNLSKFFIIPWDVNLIDYPSLFQTPEFTNNSEFYDIDITYNLLISRLLEVPEFLKKRNTLLWEYVSDEKNLNEDLSFYDETLKQVENALYGDQIKLERNGLVKSEVSRYRSIIQKNFYFLKQQLDRARIGLTFEQEKSLSNVPIRIEATYRSASPLLFEGLKIINSSDNSPDELLLFIDSNKNKEFDKYDKLIAQLAYSDGAYYNNHLGIELFSERSPSMYKSQVSIEETKENFFVVSATQNILNISSIETNFYNSITGKKLQPLIHVQSSRI